MYYLWFNETQSGPYTLQQVKSMWNAGEITAETPYWREEMTEWLLLSEIQPMIEAHASAAEISKTAVIPELQKSFVRKAPLSGGIRTATEPAPEPTQTRPEETHWTGHPTLWKWTSLLVTGGFFCLLPIAIYAFLSQSLIVALAPLPIALIIFLYVFLVRNSTKYAVTNKRVSVETGILNKSSRELRIEDIRSIAAEVNFIGYGDIEFSSAASDDAEVTFHAVAGAASVRDLVKKLQS